MTIYDFDTTVIGGGCLGSSILAELSRRGFCNLALVDAGRKNLSATAHSGGMLRVFHENLEHLDLALANHQHLKLRHLAPREPNGNLYFFNKHRYANYQSHLERMNDAQYPFEVYTAPCGRKKFPQFHWGDEEWAIYEPLAGHLVPTEFSNHLVQIAAQAGATILDNFEVFRISRDGDHYRITGRDATIKTRVLILAGGARLLPRLNELGLRLPLEARRLTTYHATRLQETAGAPNYFDRETLDFARLAAGAEMIFSLPGCPRLHEQQWQEPARKVEAEDCYAPNRLGYCGQLAGYPNLFLATGWGGTGFKFGLEVGHRIVAQLMRTQPERSSYADL